MPQTVEYTVPVRQIVVGDEVQFPGARHGEIVADTDIKTKWATISTDYGSHRIEADTEVKVFRIEDTPEEVAAKKRAFVISSITRSIESAPGNVAAAKEKLLAELDYYGGYHGRRYENFVAAQKEHQIWTQVEKTAEFMATNESGDLVDALRNVADELRGRLLDGLEGGASRSTSVMTNTINDIERGVTAVWLRTIAWYQI